MQRATRGLPTAPTRNPTQAQRIAVRKALIAMSRRRQRPGSGSVLPELLKHRGVTVDWWRESSSALAEGGVPNAAGGAIAANAYMPPRHTADFDLMIELDKLRAAGRLVAAAGWEFIADLDLYEHLEGSSWKDPDDQARELDVIGLPGDWGRAAIASAQANVTGGIPTLTLPFLVITKLISARVQDTGDLARMLGAVNESARHEVRDVVRHYRPEDLEDVEQLIELGKLEFGR